MIGRIVRGIFGTKNGRELKRMGKVVKRINALEEGMQALSDAELAALTPAFRARLADGEPLDKLLPEAFAAVREVAVRVREMRHFDVQLIGAMTLHEGGIAEMRTGEGKTLMATLAAYLNALPGKGVHLVTVNDYLARRDADWMGPIYQGLGLTVGVIQSGQSAEDKRAAYNADITHGTNNEFGFDYLRDNMAFTAADKVQVHGLNYAIVDEVDSILIDEARTPLIISGPSQQNTDLYKQINALVPTLQRHIPTEAELAGDAVAGDDAGDYVVDEKNRQIELTEAGHEKIEEMLVKAGLLEEGDSLYAATNLGLLHHVLAGLRAHVLFRRDVQYVVEDGQIMIVDEHTGRKMPGRRWSEGLHQAVEAKEGVAIQNESQTLASTTFQNYFRLYNKLSGMTGTADTEAFEFRQIYGLGVMVIPTHRPMIRNDANDLVFLTTAEKYEAIVTDIEHCRSKGQPVLVGTASIESSELVSAALKEQGIAHNVLNAKFHEKEAEIIAQAGRPGAVTVATNMAGRGTDIVLGGSWEAEVEALADSATPAKIEEIREQWQVRHNQVLEAGGLHIIGTERHESRRIDNQLRGRSGRQGDPGSTRFYLSMEDNLMRIFASDRIRSIMGSLGLEAGEAIEHRMVNNAIEKAQRKVEGHNFDIRKNLLEYDDVANDQRQVIYSQRNELMEADDISDTIVSIREEVVGDVVSQYLPPMSLPEQWDIAGLEAALQADFDSKQPIAQWLAADDDLNEEKLRERILDQITAEYQQKEAVVGAESMRVFEKQIMLQLLDQLWKDHLATMDHLRYSIGLRAYAQKQPKQEYKRESFELFQELLASIKNDVTRVLCRVQVQAPEEIEAAERQRREQEAAAAKAMHQDASAFGADDAGDSNRAAQGGRAAGQDQQAQQQPQRRDTPKVGRNEPCPCGSGRKYKQCHGKNG